MSRIRTLKPEFFRSESVAACTVPARLTYLGLWTEADDAGRGVANARTICGALWALDDNVTHCDVEAHLIELETTGHIRLYVVDGKRLFQIERWAEHQAAAYRTGVSKHPDPDDGNVKNRGKPRSVVRKRAGGEGSRGERRGEEQEGEGAGIPRTLTKAAAELVAERRRLDLTAATKKDPARYTRAALRAIALQEVEPIALDEPTLTALELADRVEPLPPWDHSGCGVCSGRGVTFSEHDSGAVLTPCAATPDIPSAGRGRNGVEGVSATPTADRGLNGTQGKREKAAR